MQKKIFFVLIILCVLPKLVTAQLFSIAELQKMRDLSPPQLENFIIKKGYRFNGRMEDNAKSYVIGSSGSPTAALFIKGKGMMFTFLNDNHYRNTIDEAERLGFKYQSEMDEDDSNGFKYAKNGLVIMFYITKSQKDRRYITIGTLGDIISFDSK